MIIDSESQYLKFLEKYNTHDLIINVLGCDDRYHPAADSPCAVFIKSIIDGHDFTISIDHPDGIWNANKLRLISDFNTFRSNLWTFDKKKTLHLLPIAHLKDIHVHDYIETGNIIDITQYQSRTHSFYQHTIGKYSDINCVIPLTMHSQWFEELTDFVLEKLRHIKVDISFDHINTDIVESFQSVESNGLQVNTELFGRFFGNKSAKIKNNLVYTEYNLFTSTGRPSNRHGSINYAALKKDDGCRSSFISRYDKDGYLFMIDYSAYHPRLIANLVRYELPIDVYNYLGKFYFDREILSDEEIKAAKTITFQLLYGNISSEYSHIPYFVKIKEYIEHRWNHFMTHGYVETPIFKRRITPNNINEANPTKLFNYILQASETEYNSIVLKDLVTYLQNKLTKPVLYTYDSVLFDVHQSDGEESIKQIKYIMTSTNNFPVKCYKGQNYNEMTVISL